MSSEFVLKWGIVSAGHISADFCVSLLSLNTPYQKLIAVGARNENDAKQFAERFQMPHYFGSYQRLMESNEINIVYVGSINITHKDICLMAINAGKHVLCEKPMSMNVKEQEEVLQAAKKKGVFFMEALKTRFFPVMDKLRDELAKKTIGPQVNYFCSTFLAPLKEIDRIKKKEMGGGVVLDIGIYPIQLACLVFNHEKPIKITAVGHLMSTGVDECCSITLLYPGQRIAQINVSGNCKHLGTTFIAGEKGTIQIPEFSWCPNKLLLPDGTLHVENLPENHCVDIKMQDTRRLGLRYQAEAIRKSIGEGLLEHPYVKHDDSRLIMNIMEEVLKQLGYYD